jgi:enoyl-CoA hydratase
MRAPVDAPISNPSGSRAPTSADCQTEHGFYRGAARLSTMTSLLCATGPEEELVPIDVEIAGGIGSVTLNEPKRRNALTPEMAGEFVAILDRLAADESVAAVVLAGAGRGFCAGADLSTLGEAGQDPLSDENYGAISSIYAAFSRFGSLPMPTIAAVTGAAVGAGLNLALAADVRIVAQDARLISGFLRIGVHPGGGHLHLLSRVASRDTIAAMAIFGEEVSGDDAVRLGLAWRAVPADQVLGDAHRLAARIADRAELARATARTLRLEVPGSVTWEAAIQLERGPQLRSLRQRTSPA